MNMNENKEESTAPSLLDAVKARAVKRGQPPHTFESVKHVVQAMIEGESIAGLSKRMNIHYQTLNRQKIAAQEFLDQNNTKRVMSAEDIAWVKHLLEAVQKKQS